MCLIPDYDDRLVIPDYESRFNEDKFHDALKNKQIEPLSVQEVSPVQVISSLKAWHGMTFQSIEA